ncbi:MAG: hypothetical protein JWM98_2833 [Thermoleophilia bacterium]|nr:hypothetical protein [Thermoleophilia bacterium]
MGDAVSGGEHMQLTDVQRAAVSAVHTVTQASAVHEAVEIGVPLGARTEGEAVALTRATLDAAGTYPEAYRPALIGAFAGSRDAAEIPAVIQAVKGIARPTYEDQATVVAGALAGDVPVGEIAARVDAITTAIGTDYPSLKHAILAGLSSGLDATALPAAVAAAKQAATYGARAPIEIAAGLDGARGAALSVGVLGVPKGVTAQELEEVLGDAARSGPLADAIAAAQPVATSASRRSAYGASPPSSSGLQWSVNPATGASGFGVPLGSGLSLTFDGHLASGGIQLG